MSCIVWPRTASGLCSPSAHSTASVTFDLRAVHLGDRLETALVRRPLLAHDAVGDELAALREALLELALEVRHVRDRVLDLGMERFRDGGRGPLEAELEEAGPDPGLHRLGQNAVRLHQATGLVLKAGRRRRPDP